MLHQHPSCLLCNSVALKKLQAYQAAHLLKCSSCHFVFSGRIPSGSELAEHYKGYPRDTDISPITVKRYHELLDRFEPYRNSGNLLDIGCGDGYFLEVAKSRNWKVYGTEFTDEAVGIAEKKGIIMHRGILDPGNYPNTRFDVISSFEVIEHINNPQDELKNIVSLLERNGVFYVTTPNFNSLSRYLLKEKWNVIEYPEHLSYYTPATMHSFFKKNGLEKVSLQTSGISLSRFRQSVAARAEDTVVETEESLREKTETKAIYKLAKNGINLLLNTFSMGDTIKGLYRKAT